MKLLLISIFALSVPALACPPGSRCGVSDGNSDMSELTGCQDLKKVAKIRQADNASRKALNLMDEGEGDADDYKTSCDAPATQDTDQLKRIYQQGYKAGDTIGRARQATDEARGLLDEIAKPLNDLGMEGCINSVKATSQKVTAAREKLNEKGKVLGKCGATGGGEIPASPGVLDKYNQGMAAASGPNNTTSIPDPRPTRDTYDARWCGLGGCEQGPDGKWRVKSGR